MRALRLVSSSALVCLAVLLIGGTMSASTRQRPALFQALSNADGKALSKVAATTSTLNSGT